MDTNHLRVQLRNLEREAQSSLAADASFLEALQCLKWQIDRDARVKAAMNALRDRGLKVFSSFTPRIRIRLLAGETIVALPTNTAESNRPHAEDFGYVNQIATEPLIQAVRDAASAVVLNSRHSLQLDGIVNEAVQANSAFEKIATDIERAGYQVNLCLDLSAYAQVRDPRSKMSHVAKKSPVPPDMDSCSPMALSGQDLQFLKDMRILPE
jgi:hypothetical protein